MLTGNGTWFHHFYMSWYRYCSMLHTCENYSGSTFSAVDILTDLKLPIPESMETHAPNAHNGNNNPIQRRQSLPATSLAEVDTHAPSSPLSVRLSSMICTRLDDFVQSMHLDGDSQECTTATLNSSSSSSSSSNIPCDMLPSMVHIDISSYKTLWINM